MLAMERADRSIARIVMYQAGQLELRCTSLLDAHTADRPTFEATLARGFGNPRQFQVFAMAPGLLFLDRRDQKETSEHQSNPKAVFAWALVGGVVGGLIAAALTKRKVTPAKRETGLELQSDEALLQLAKERKKSFVVPHEDVRAITVDPPSAWDRMFGHRTLAGWITVDTVNQGKLRLEFRDAAVMASAAESLPRRYGGRVIANAELDLRRKRFVPRGCA
jgi:hypothetical protein